MVGGGSVVSQNLHFPGSLAVSVQVRRRGGGVGRLEGRGLGGEGGKAGEQPEVIWRGFWETS